MNARDIAKLFGFFVIIALLYKAFSTKEGYMNNEDMTYVKFNPKMVEGTQMMKTPSAQPDRLKPYLSKPRIGGINKIDSVGKNPNYLLFNKPNKKITPGKGLPIYKPEYEQQGGLQGVFSLRTAEKSMPERAI